jgi:hypothetical protein
MRILPAQTRALLGRTNSRAFSVDPDRLRIPDTMIAREAEALSSEVCTQALLNHCLRSYAWGTILAERDGLEHDPELFYVTCRLHDLGVTDRYRDTVAGQRCGRCVASAPCEAVAIAVAMLVLSSDQRGGSRLDDRAHLPKERVTIVLEQRVPSSVWGHRVAGTTDGAMSQPSPYSC